MKTGLIYMYTNKLNGKRYVGQTIQSLEQRDKKHYFDKNNTYFDRAYKKYGRNNFDLIVLEEDVPIELLNEKEKYYIEKYNTTHISKKGYNMTRGGQWGGVLVKTTLEQEKEVKNLLMTTKLTFKEIAKQVGTTFYSVCGINSGDSFYDKNISYPIRGKVKRNYLSSKVVDNIINEILNTKKTLVDISKKYNTNVYTINKINQGKTKKFIREGLTYPLRTPEQISTYFNKITIEEVKSLCEDLIINNFSVKQAIEKYGIAKNTISDISRGLTWKKVTNGLKYPIIANRKENLLLIHKIIG